MTATNPHPLANPFNRQKYAAYEMQQPHKAITKCDDPSKLQVPQSTVTYEQALEQQRQLTVPYSAADDLGVTGATGVFGFIGNSTLFALQDGSVLDIKTHKIVFDPNIKFKAKGYWNDPNEESKNSMPSNEWGKTPSINSLLNDYDAMDGSYDPNLSPESVRYWKMAKEESKKLEKNMTDEQRMLMQQLDAEKFFPMTRLKEEK